MAIYRVMVGKDISGEYDEFVHAESMQEAVTKFKDYEILCPLNEKAKKELESKPEIVAVEIKEEEGIYPEEVIAEFRRLADYSEWILSNNITVKEFPNAT